MPLTLGSCILWEASIGLLAVFILETHYPSGRTWANICSLSGYASQSIKTGTRRIMRLDELCLVMRRERRITKDNSTGRISCLCV